MRSIYKRLGDYIIPCNEKNVGNQIKVLRGISNQKYFQKPKTNTIGIDLSTYRIVRTGEFAFNRATTRNGDKISIALRKGKDCIVSPSYRIFKSKDENILNSEYLMMWYRRPEFDRYTRFKSHGSAHEFFDFEEMCEVELPIPSLEAQQKIVDEYNTVVNHIQVGGKFIRRMEELAQWLFKNLFINKAKDDWELVKLGDLLEVKGGLSYKIKDVGTGSSLLLGMGCVSSEERFSISGIRLYSDTTADTHVAYPGDIIIATRQQTENLPILGFPAMIPSSLANNRVIVGTNLYRVINNSDLSNEVIFEILRSKKYRNHILLNTKGTTVSMITKDAVENFSFRLPPKKHVEELQNSLKPIIKLIDTYTHQIQKLNQLQSILLSKMTVVDEAKSPFQTEAKIASF